ncbi:MAG: thiosulfate oxidation carrier complex protein SoxZ [Gammaproteobacteria bacterium]|nr:thiosulfate oxidation carrier complex protein SoxZ [Gammaproteobacteria bacterium]MCP5319023.1 thiosulfate oxidation carrier complex protein SoxZ [Chromatiaceae bacterium]MCW5586496.1 thiosulfate oxidation carrier complex protein SoxZ [Chromatiales bacterium]MCB1818993.1 thiosulfate oxidation carrier complex protein SoxZ [Gammaproteobacteria bacterium]MCP5430311.1 thiosulfate oxidation carrier complex protein SoxZ [Chromatiaceae bacterium]
MANSIKIRAKIKDNTTEVKCLITHPMETGLRKDSKTGQLIPAHFINEVMADVGGKSVMNAQWSGGISKNPYLSFSFTGAAKGDEVKITWADNQGGGDSETATIS